MGAKNPPARVECAACDGSVQRRWRGHHNGLDGGLFEHPVEVCIERRAWRERSSGHAGCVVRLYNPDHLQPIGGGEGWKVDQLSDSARAYEAESGAMQVHAYDAPATVAGQGTLFAEWEAQGLDADTVLIAVGGGGLISGALGWFQDRRKVVAVEPATSCALKSALMTGAPTNVDVSGIAANALGARRIGDICFDLASAQRTPSVIVPDAAIEAAQHALWRDHRLLVEPAGATALAALMCGAYLPARGEKVAVLLCGGNIDPEPLSDPATQVDVSFT